MVFPTSLLPSFLPSLYANVENEKKKEICATSSFPHVSAVMSFPFFPRLSILSAQIFLLLLLTAEVTKTVLRA